MISFGSPSANNNFGWSAANIAALVILSISTMFTHLNMAVVGFLLPLIKDDLQLSDAMLGVVSGLAFTALYTFLIIPMAWFADNTNRKRVIGFGFLFFSLMTFLTGYVSNVIQLIVARALVGAGESTNLGPTKSIIADMFERRHRVVALSIISASTTLAGLLLIPIFVPIAEEHGWRVAFQAIGIVGILFALVLFLVVKEPHLGASDGAKSAGARVALTDGLRTLFRSRAYVLIAIGGALLSCFVNTAATWETTFLVRVRGYSIGDAATLLGPVRSIAGICGLFLGAFIAKALRTNGQRALLLPIAALGLTTTELVLLFAEPRWMWVAAAALSGAFITIHVGVLMTVLSMLVPPRVRGMAVAVFMLAGHLLGHSVGPPLVGLINDALTPSLGLESVRYGLLLAVGAAAISVLFLYAGARRVDECISQADALRDQELGRAARPAA